MELPLADRSSPGRGGGGTPLLVLLSRFLFGNAWRSVAMISRLRTFWANPWVGVPAIRAGVGATLAVCWFHIDSSGQRRLRKVQQELAAEGRDSTFSPTAARPGLFPTGELLRVGPLRIWRRCRVTSRPAGEEGRRIARGSNERLKLGMTVLPVTGQTGLSKGSVRIS